MAITTSAKKALRSSQRKRVFNMRCKRTMREIVKRLGALIREGKKTEAQEELPQVYKAIDKAAKRGVLKQNTANRKKSRLVAAIKKIS